MKLASSNLYCITIYVLIALLLLCHLTFSLPGPEVTLDYTFEEYLKEFPDKQTLYLQSNDYDVEYKLRESIFKQELEEVVRHNALNLSWRKSLNQFSDLTEEEFLKYYTGNIIGPEETEPLHQYTLQRETERILNGGTIPKDSKTSQTLLADLTGLPNHVDWSARMRGARNLKNQGRCGSCFSMVASSLLEYYIVPQAGHEIELSTQQAVSCFPNPRSCGGTGGCHGYTSGHIMNEYAKDVGLVLEKDYPYVSGADGSEPACRFDEAQMPVVVKTEGAKRLTPNDPTQLLRTVAFEGPVSVSLSGAGIKNYYDGVLTNCTGPWNEKYQMYETVLSHAMILVGYGVNKDGIGYWKLSNSWGNGWARDGFAYIYRPIGEPEQEFINVKPSSGYTCKDEPQDPFVVTGTCGLLANNFVPIKPRYIPPPT